MVTGDGIYIKGPIGERTCAVISGGRLVGLANEADVTAGAVYIGRIVSISSTMNCLFLDIGEDRNAFMPAADGLKKGLYRCGQSMIVQSQKNPRGNKGRQVTDRINLVGYLVCAEPGSDRLHVSSRISDIPEKERLRDAAAEAQALLSDRYGPFGISVRTNASGCSEQAVIDESVFLAKEWDACAKRFSESARPGRIRGAGDFLEYCISSFADGSTPEVIVDNKESADLLMEHKKKMPDGSGFAVRLYAEEYDMFAFYNLCPLITHAFDRRVVLPSGGSIVIDTTEAFIAIDVNSGRGSNRKETALVTNLEAAEEIAAQLRLRNIGGIIVIDFINMTADEETAVEARLRELSAKDRMISGISGFSPFGLIEICRRRR